MIGTSPTCAPGPGSCISRSCWTPGAGRSLVGPMANHLRTELVLDALEMAIGQRRPGDVIHHSDQGSQYTSLAFGGRCREAGVRPSMGSVGDAYDNAMCESFSPRWNVSFWSGAGLRPRQWPKWPASALSKAGTIPFGCTPRWLPLADGIRSYGGRHHGTVITKPSNTPRKRGSFTPRWLP